MAKQPTDGQAETLLSIEVELDAAGRPTNPGLSIEVELDVGRPTSPGVFIDSIDVEPDAGRLTNPGVFIASIDVEPDAGRATNPGVFIASIDVELAAGRLTNPGLSIDVELVGEDDTAREAAEAGTRASESGSGVLEGTKRPASARAVGQSPPSAAQPLAVSGPGDFGRFEDEGEVARGGMSSIHRVVDLRLGRRQAMKVLDPSSEPDARAVERFVYEARITGQLDHPNIVPIYDLGLDAGGAPAFITMKLVAGESLADFLDRAGDDRLGSRLLERALQILLKVCDAVAFAHGRGIIHCDIKPANIMIGSHGQVYMMDWGLAVATATSTADAAKNWSPRPLRQGTVTGTPAYMSPEQALGKVDHLDFRTDVYGLGATLYRLLTGRPPHAAETVYATVEKAQTGVVPPPTEVARDRRLPPELCRIAMKALAADPARRYQTVEALKEDLESFQRGGGWLPIQTFAKGEVIVREGDTAQAAYILIEGVVEVYKTVDDRRVTLRLMGPGEVFGEAAVFMSQPRTASVAAKSDVRVRVVTADSLDLELSQNTWMGALVKALAERFRDLDAQLTRLNQAVASGNPKAG
jgi:tRNA A-37 threonylcarbamoyl transferase component Bud32